MNNKSLIIAGVIALAIVWLIVPARSSNDLHTEIFCAYDSIFVEFDNNGNKWGTMLLDRQGHPIPCNNKIEKVMREQYDKRI